MEEDIESAVQPIEYEATVISVDAYQRPSSSGSTITGITLESTNPEVETVYIERGTEEAQQFFKKLYTSGQEVVVNALARLTPTCPIIINGEQAWVAGGKGEWCPENASVTVTGEP